jgi:cytochrome P450
VQLGEEKLDRIKADLAEETLKGGEPNPDNSFIFHRLLRSDLPEFEKHASRLSAETVVILGGGSINPSATLTLITYYVLARPHMHKRLSEELKDVMVWFPDRLPTRTELEKVSYLVACVKEGLR